jgi:predicted ATP-binding protein involved in virulence
MRFELKLRDIELHNFRLFDEVKINFDDKLTVLIGENGAGKTALLEGVAKALNAIVLRLRKNTTELDEHKYYALTDVKYGQEAILTDINLEQIFEDDENESEASKVGDLALKQIDEEYKIRFAELNEKLNNSEADSDEDKFWRNEIDLLESEVKKRQDSIYEEHDIRTSRDQKNIKYRLNPTYNEDIQKEPFAEDNIWIIEEVARKVDKNRKDKKDINLPVIVYYPCERIITDSKNGKDETYGMNMFNAYDHALDGLSLDYKRFLAWYDWQERIERFNKNNRVLDIVRQSILDILNDADDTAFSTIDIDPSEYNNPKLIIQKGDDKVEVNQLSSGEKSLLMLVSNLAYRMALLNPNSKDPLKEGQGIVLIDEIDLHLHPRWQREVVPKLLKLFPKIQWVVTTHSPLVLSYAPEGKALRLVNKEIKEYKYFRGMRLTDIFYDLYNTIFKTK